MKVIVSARDYDLTETLRELVERRCERLARYEPKAKRAEVHISGEGSGCRADAQVSIDGSGGVHASAVAPDPRSALDQMVQKLARQLRKNHSRRRDHKAKARGSNPPGGLGS